MMPGEDEIRRVEAEKFLHGFIPTVSWQDYANLESRVALLELKVQALEEGK
jgi:hypothetical protein